MTHGPKNGLGAPAGGRGRVTRPRAAAGLPHQAAQQPRTAQAAVAGPFDGLLFGDVPEHLTDPLAVSRRLPRRLAPGGFVPASAPNAQHHSLVADLLRADSQYRPADLLGDTHLRSITYATALNPPLDAD